MYICPSITFIYCLTEPYSSHIYRGFSQKNHGEMQDFHQDMAISQQ